MIRYCTRCVYNDLVNAITFDRNGVCNYCHSHDQLVEEYPTGEKGAKILDKLCQEIRADGKGKKYDAIVGVSGGCDSSYLLVELKKRGIRPLAVHFDNTWNSTTATENIDNVLKSLDIDLFTVVVNNKEFDDIITSFIRAGTPDVDCATDIALATTLYRAAEKYKVNYFIDGHSFRTEGISPLGWNYQDAKYIQTVHQQFGKRKMKTFPNLWFSSQLKWMLFNRIKRVRPIYYMDYIKEDAKKMLIKDHGWKWYGGHHLENRYTAFAHLYVFPYRFNIDTRQLETGALVRSGQMDRDDAMDRLSRPVKCPDELLIYLKKRLGFSNEEFDQLMNQPRVNYKAFTTYKPMFEKLSSFYYWMYRFDLVPKSFYTKFTKPDTYSPDFENIPFGKVEIVKSAKTFEETVAGCD